jgi:hypothetical protein
VCNMRFPTPKWLRLRGCRVRCRSTRTAGSAFSFSSCDRITAQDLLLTLFLFTPEILRASNSRGVQFFNYDCTISTFNDFRLFKCYDIWVFG